MRVAITAGGCSPEAFVDARFLAAHNILIFDTLDGQWDNIKLSPWLLQKRGGRTRVRLIMAAGVEILISRGVDPLSFKSLVGNGVRIYEAPEGTAGEALAMFLAERLLPLNTPDAIDITKVGSGRRGQLF